MAKELSSRNFSVLRVWRRGEYYKWALLLREGDKCTKFFHHVANLLKGNNTIEMMIVYGVLSSNLP